MRKQEKTELTVEQAIHPIVTCQLNFREQRMLLHEFFTTTVANAPEDEIENFTANRFTKFYLALCQTLENLDSISQIHSDNILFCMDRIVTKKNKP